MSITYHTLVINENDEELKNKNDVIFNLVRRPVDSVDDVVKC